MSLDDVPRQKVLRLGGLIFVSTCLLTLDLIGILAFVDASPPEFWARFPYYLLAAASMFVGSLFYLEGQFSNGGHIILSAVGIGAMGLVVVAMAVEGLRFSITSPGNVFTKNVLVYFLTAGLLCTGLGYWIIRHWREYVSTA